MPKFQVIVCEDSGQIEILGASEFRKAEKHEKVLGEFLAESEPEAWRRFGTLNPTVDMQQKRVTTDVDADAEFAKAKEEFKLKATKKAVASLELPEDSGPAEPEDEHDDETKAEKKTTHGGKQHAHKAVIHTKATK